MSKKHYKDKKQRNEGVAASDNNAQQGDEAAEAFAGAAHSAFGVGVDMQSQQHAGNHIDNVVKRVSEEEGGERFVGVEGACAFVLIVYLEEVHQKESGEKGARNEGVALVKRLLVVFSSCYDSDGGNDVDQEAEREDAFKGGKEGVAFDGVDEEVVVRPVGVGGEVEEAGEVDGEVEQKEQHHGYGAELHHLAEGLLAVFG